LKTLLAHKAHKNPTHKICARALLPKLHPHHLGHSKAQRTEQRQQRQMQVNSSE